METSKFTDSKLFRSGFVVILIASVIVIFQGGVAFGKWLQITIN